METSERGYVHVYTGDGKGKTTAAFGLALRALGAGWRVLVAQFVKGMRYGECAVLEGLSERVEVRQYGRDCFIEREPEAEDIRLARAGLGEVREAIRSGEYRLVVLDEVTIATRYSLFSVDELLELVRSRPRQLELVLTGRYADPRLVEEADLVTEMREVKHYYTRGVLAREGIER